MAVREIYGMRKLVSGPVMQRDRSRRTIDVDPGMPVPGEK